MKSATINIQVNKGPIRLKNNSTVDISTCDWIVIYNDGGTTSNYNYVLNMPIWSFPKAVLVAMSNAGVVLQHSNGWHWSCTSTTFSITSGMTSDVWVFYGLKFK